MKTIVVDARGRNTGSGRYVQQLVTFLQQADSDLSHRYKILVEPKDIDAWNLSSKRFELIATHARRYSYLEQITLAWQLYWLRADLVHFTSTAQPLVYLRRGLTTVQELTAIRFGTDTKRYKYKAWLYRMALRKTPRIIVPSEFTKDDIAKFAHINSRKIVVVPQGSDSIGGITKKVPELEHTRYITYVGRGYVHKNLRRLVEAFQIVLQTQPDLHLVFAGKKDSGYRSLERFAAKHEIPNVIFTDYLEDAQLKWLYENTEAYVFPSESEGFGLPGLEAMAHGAPVVSSNATALPEVYGEAAEYFDPLDVEDMAKKINKVLTNPERRKKLISAGKQRASKYSWEKMAEQTLAEYKLLLKEN